VPSVMTPTPSIPTMMAAHIAAVRRFVASAPMFSGASNNVAQREINVSAEIGLTQIAPPRGVVRRCAVVLLQLPELRRLTKQGHGVFRVSRRGDLMPTDGGEDLSGRVRAPVAIILDQAARQ